MITACKRFVQNVGCAALLPYLLLTFAVFAVYSNIYANAFLYDDESLIVHNRFLQHWHDLPKLFFTSLNAGNNLASAYYRPLQSLLYFFVAQMAGLSLFAFHFLNLVLHALNACLLYRLGLKFTFKPVAVFCAALLWALHPVQTEAVTYMSATADTLYTFFCLLGVSALLPDFTPCRIVWALSFMFLGLLSKEAAVSFPLLAASCFYFVSEKRFEYKAYIRFWPLLGMASAYVLLHHMLLPHSFAAPQTGTATTDADYSHIAILSAYLKLLIWPTGLHMGHDLPLCPTLWRADILCGIVLFVAATTQILREQAARSLPLNWGLCWFAAALAPTFFVNAIFYEHWLYLPTAGLFLGVAQSVALWMEQAPPAISKWVKPVLAVFVMMASAALGSLTYNQNKIWREPVAFYNTILAYGGTAANAHINLGLLYARQGDYEKAIQQNQIAIRNSQDSLSVAQANLAIIENMLPQGSYSDEEILGHLRRALEIDPNFYPALDALASFYVQRNDAAQAAFYRGRADAVRKTVHTDSDVKTGL